MPETAVIQQSRFSLVATTSCTSEYPTGHFKFTVSRQRKHRAIGFYSLFACAIGANPENSVARVRTRVKQMTRCSNDGTMNSSVQRANDLPSANSA